jgi:Fe-S-cluster containining protein
MNCRLCKGACCEEAVADESVVLSRDVTRWITLHRQEDGGSGRCTALQSDGLCAIYSERPMVCALYAPGGPDCLATVARLRTPEQYQAIRDAYDPPTL